MNEAELDEYIDEEEGEDEYPIEAEFVEDPNFKDDSISTLKKHQGSSLFHLLITKNFKQVFYVLNLKLKPLCFVSIRSRTIWHQAVKTT